MCTNETGTEALQFIIGKRVKVKCNLRGASTPITVVGICTFIGVNPLHNQFQITVSRMPLWPVELKNIQIIE